MKFIISSNNYLKSFLLFKSLFILIIFISTFNLLLSFNIKKHTSNKAIIKENFIKIKEYFKLINKYIKSNKSIDCNRSFSCRKHASNLDNRFILNYKIWYIYKKIHENANITTDFDNKKFNKDINEINNNCDFIKSSYLVELLNNSKNNLFKLYTLTHYYYINWISKSINFKETAIKIITESNTPNLIDSKFNNLLDKFILVYRTIGAYMRLYSTDEPNKDRFNKYKPIYRGTTLFKDDPILNKTNTNIILCPNPLSFSYSRKVALMFSKVKDESKKVSILFKIKNTENCFGKNLNTETLTEFDFEQEFLIRSFTYFKILMIINIRDKKIAFLECLDNNIEHINNYIMK